MEDVEKKNINYQSSHSNLKTNSSTKKNTHVFLKPHLISARCSSSDFLGSKSEGFQDLAAKTLCFPNCGGVGLVALPPQLLGVAEIGWCCYKWQCPAFSAIAWRKEHVAFFFSSFANNIQNHFWSNKRYATRLGKSMSVDMIEQQTTIGDAFSTSFCLFINMAFAESTCCTFTTRFPDREFRSAFQMVIFKYSARQLSNLTTHLIFIRQQAFRFLLGVFGAFFRKISSTLSCETAPTCSTNDSMPANAFFLTWQKTRKTCRCEAWDVHPLNPPILSWRSSW